MIHHLRFLIPILQSPHTAHLWVHYLHYAFVGLLPGFSNVRRTLGQHMRASGEAIRILADDPRNANALHKLANAMSHLNQHREAIASYDKALAVAPDTPAIWRDRDAAASKVRGFACSLCRRFGQHRGSAG